MLFAGGESSAGGDGVQLDDGNIYLLDLVESNTHLLGIEENELSVPAHFEKIAESKLKDLDVDLDQFREIISVVYSVNPLFAYSLMVAIEMHNWFLAPFSLINVEDEDFVHEFEDTRIVQLAVRRNKSVYLNKNIWMSGLINSENKIATILHEALYSLANPQKIKNRSSRVREIIGTLFKNYDSTDLSLSLKTVIGDDFPNDAFSSEQSHFGFFLKQLKDGTVQRQLNYAWTAKFVVESSLQEGGQKARISGEMLSNAPIDPFAPSNKTVEFVESRESRESKEFFNKQFVSTKSSLSFPVQKFIKGHRRLHQYLVRNKIESKTAFLQFSFSQTEGVYWVHVEKGTHYDELSYETFEKVVAKKGMVKNILQDFFKNSYNKRFNILAPWKMTIDRKLNKNMFLNSEGRLQYLFHENSHLD